MKLTDESKIGEHEKQEGNDPGAAFPYPSAGEIWVEHVLEARGGVKELRCVRCAFLEEAAPAPPAELPDSLLKFFVRGKEVSCQSPRGPFIVACAPYFSPLPGLPFISGVIAKVSEPQVPQISGKGDL